MYKFHSFWQSSFFASLPDGELGQQSQLLNNLVESVPANRRLKHDRTTTVVASQLAGKAVIIKRYNPRNHWHKLKRAFRTSRARRCWNMTRVFQEVGLNVARPLMMVEKRIGPIRVDAFFVCQALDGEELLSQYPIMDSQTRGEVEAAVVEAFDVLKRHRISHGDMKATNLLWVDSKLFFIDLDAAQQHSRWSLTWSRSHNKDRRRFMKNWQNDPRLAKGFKGVLES